MMRCILVTDHSSHRHFDSVYLLARYLDALPDVEAFVVNLGDVCNQRNLKQPTDTFHAIKPSDDFCFENREVYFSQQWQNISVASVDFVLLRLIPFNEAQLLQLSRVFTSAHFFNTAQGIIKTESKAFLHQLSAHTPFIAPCESLAQLTTLSKNRAVVLKPLYGFGGKGNILLGPEMCVEQGQPFTQRAMLQQLAPRFEQGERWLAMEYLPNASKGDKRILVLNGEIMGASLRLPVKDDWLCNVSNGGRSVNTEVSHREVEMIRDISRVLAAEGIALFGTDTLLNQQGERVLSEVNTLCIGGFYTQHNVLGNKQVILNTVNSLHNIMLSQLALQGAVNC